MALIAGCAAGPVIANEIELLYDPAPPADAAYVRVVNLSADKVDVSGLSAQPIALGTAENRRVSRYELITGRSSVQLAVRAGGKAFSHVVPVGRGRYVTVGLPDRGVPIVVEEAPSDFNQMKAQLAFYAFSQGCNSGQLGLAAKPDVRVFDAVAAGSVSRRAVNPVAAEVLVRCVAPSGDAGRPFVLEGIAPGKRVSVFMFGDPAAPQAAVSADVTAAPRRP